MHNVIQKFDLQLLTIQKLHMPIGSTILSAYEQMGKVWISALVDTKEKQEIRSFAIVGVGNALPKINPDQFLTNINSVQAHGLVWHVFEIIQK